MKEGKAKRFFEGVLEILFPSDYKCVFCSSELNIKTPTLTCEKCEKTLPKLDVKNVCEKCGDLLVGDGKICLVCKDLKRNFDIARAPFLYDGKVRNSIKNFKFEGAKYLFKPMATYLSKTYYECGFEADLIMPVPMTEKGKKSRGYNQAEELAKQLSNFILLPLDVKNLIKHKKSGKQVGLGFSERSKNVKNCFKVLDKKQVKGKCVLLVDDVLTSGATCDECAKAVKKAGAKKVLVLTLARTHISERNKKNQK